MKNARLSCVIVLVVLSLGSMASAATWNGAAGPDLPYWDVGENWGGTAPTSGTIDISSAIDVPNDVEPWGCVFDEFTAPNLGVEEPLSFGRFRVGTNATSDAPGIFTMTGGSFDAVYIRIAKNSAEEVGVFNLRGGEVTLSGRSFLRIGVAGTGTLNMTGGSIITGGEVHLGVTGSGFGYLNMAGGTIEAAGGFNTTTSGHIRMSGGQIICEAPVNVSGNYCQYDLYGGSITAPSLSIAEGMNMDVSGGKVVLGTNANLDTYLNDGRLTSWGGLGTIVITEVNNPDVNDANTLYELTGTADAEILAKAWKPSPESGTIIADEEMTLTWIAGQGMKSQNVYFGKDPEALEVLPNDPNDPNEGIIQGVLSVDYSYDVNGLVLGNTYYWRVDEVDESGAVTTGDVWSFINKPLELASVVSPLDEAVGVNTVDLTLEWESGLGAVSADVYFGNDAENLALVADDTTETTYAVTQPLILGMTYYWRVDSFDGTDVYKGLLWSFTVTAPAANSDFTDGDPANSLWSSPDNWSAGVPGVGTRADLENTEGVIAVVDANTTAYCGSMRFGWATGSTADMDITGGSLTVTGTMDCVRNAGSQATLFMYDGVFNVDYIRAWHGDIWIEMLGGEMNVGTLEIPRSYTSTEGASGVLKLIDGVVHAGNITLNNNEAVVSLIDVNDGLLILDGDQVAKVNGYVDAGLITAYGGTKGSISVFYDAEAGLTMVRACEQEFQADFNGDCVVDDLDRDLLVAALGTTTPEMSKWDFDMSTDPTGEDMWDLHTRNDNNADYEMSGEGTLLVNGSLLLDQHANANGIWDSDLHFVAKALSGETSPLNLWLTVGTSSAAGSRAYVGFSQYVNASGTQSLKLWTGNPPHVAPFEPVMVEGFAADTMVDLQISYDFETDTFDWTATDGSLSLSGTDVPYTVFGGGSGGSFTIQGTDETIAEIDQFTYTIHGSDTYSPYDLNKDHVVDQLDLDILEAEMGQ